MCASVYSVTSNSLWPQGPQPARLLCTWNFPSKSIGASCHFLLQGLYLPQGLNPRSCITCIGRQIVYHWATGNPLERYTAAQLKTSVSNYLPRIISFPNLFLDLTINISIQENLSSAHYVLTFVPRFLTLFF